MPNQCHYWVHHELYFKDGKLEPESNLWMGPVYLVRRSAQPAAEEVWFVTGRSPCCRTRTPTTPKLLGLDVRRAP